MRKMIPYMMLTAVFILFGGAAFASDLLVPLGYKTIQEAVNAAASKDTVIVSDGVYIENIVIKKPLTLKSTGGSSSAIVTAANPDEPVIKVADTEGVTIEGLTAKGSGTSGIMLLRVSGSIVKSNAAIENAYGIALYDSSGNTVEGNTANLNEYYGIYLERSSANAILDNTASRNLDKGLFVSYSNRNTIKGNNANLNTWNGMMIWSSNNNTITGNMTLRNTYGIVVSDSKDNELADNTTLPNVFLILPIVLIYLGIIIYMIQKNVLKLLHRS